MIITAQYLPRNDVTQDGRAFITDIVWLDLCTVVHLPLHHSGIPALLLL